MLELSAWNSFYVIVGSAAGALIGLQFVVMTLLAGRPQIPTPEAGAAFATPTIVHFATVLFLSALLCAPWQIIIPVEIIIGLTGFCGVVYTSIVVHHMRTQEFYRPQFEDWFFHALLPLAAYTTLTLSAFAMLGRKDMALLAVGASALMLLFTGIHNAWDSVVYHIFFSRRDTNSERQREHKTEIK